jgi:Co/Zn/Cd efflux system component
LDDCCQDKGREVERLVLFTAAGVWLADLSWPDVLVGLLIAALFLRSAARVVREAWPSSGPKPGINF